MRVNDAETKVDQMIRDTAKKKKQGILLLLVRQQDACKDLGGRRNLASSRQHMHAPPVQMMEDPANAAK